jgi:hypothetical protein
MGERFEGILKEPEKTGNFKRRILRDQIKKSIGLS